MLTRTTRPTTAARSHACHLLSHDSRAQPTVTAITSRLAGARRLFPPTPVGPQLLPLSLPQLPPRQLHSTAPRTRTPPGFYYDRAMNNPAWTVRALTTPGPDSDLSIFVAFDNARFLFGAGEGTQRAFVQKRVGMRSMQAVFLPGGSWGRGGLPGVLMTAADAGIKGLGVVGPPDTAQYLATLRGSVIRDTFGVVPHVFPRGSTADAEVVYDSQRMTVHAVALRPDEAQTSIPAGPERPSTLPADQLNEWTHTIVRDMFRGGTDHSACFPPSTPFPGLARPCLPDDRFSLPVPSAADVATDMVYICRTPDVRGKFDVVKANALNVPKGPVRARLTQGESIEVDDPDVPGGKRIVRPEDCLVGGGQGAVLIVVHCSDANVERLLASRAFTQYQGTTPEVGVHTIVHRVSRPTWEDARYQAWVASFGPQAHHLFADAEGTNQTVFTSAAWNALRLNMLDSDVFPVPHCESSPPAPPALPANASVLVPNHVARMHPTGPPEILPNHEKDIEFPHDAASLDAAREWIRTQSPEYAAAVDAARASVAQEAALRENTPSVPGDDIVVTTLGTGSAIPSKYRNVSSTHVDIPGVGGALLDAGEGTLGQLRRRFGPEGLKKVYKDLRLVFISHMHADHHLGLSAVLADRFKNGVHTPLYLVAPYPIALQLQETRAWQDGVPREALENLKFINVSRVKWPYMARQGSEDDVEVAPASGIAELPVDESADDAQNHTDDPNGAPVDAPPQPHPRGVFPESLMVEAACEADVAAGKREWPFVNVFRSHPDCTARIQASLDALLADMGLVSIQAPPVAHRGAAYGLVLAHASGWKLAYSGDTKPCSAFVHAARGATVLIHEATLEDDKPDVAYQKGHSTFGQAIDVGRAMGARYVILNHFSQRYPKIPKLTHVPADTTDVTNGTTAIDPSVAISFDFMSLRVRDTWKLAHYMDAMSILYAEEDEDDGVLDGDDSKAKNADGKAAKQKQKQQQQKQKQRQPKEARQRDRAQKQKQQQQTQEQTGARTGAKRESDASGDEPEAKKARA